MVYIGAENIVSPLGATARENFKQISEGETGVKLMPVGVNGESFPVSGFEIQPSALALSKQSMAGTLNLIDLSQITGKCALILSSTKGDIDQLTADQPYSISSLVAALKEEYSFISETFTVSNACVSGVMGINLAADLIADDQFDHVLVVGVDLLTSFTVSGFQAFFAMSDELCRPYDQQRKGINIGEAASSVWMSKSDSIFKETAYHFLGGATRNDANHISGPSRNGEGLFRTIESTLNAAVVGKEDLDYICSHGTATNYNDEMESQAFNRTGLLEVPMNSLKAYFGHTLGAAGLVETSIALQSLRAEKLVASKGYEMEGVSFPMNVLAQNRKCELNTIIKTSSGFGGCNSALVISKNIKTKARKISGQEVVLLGALSIDSKQVTVDGAVVLKLEGDPLREMYEDLNLSYSKFHKMDPLCKLGVLGIEYLINAFPVLRDQKDDEIGMVFESKWGSSYSDMAHQKHLNEKNPSPAVFVYTLPNIVLGEISIKHKWYGESISLITDETSSKVAGISSLYLRHRKIKYAISGKIEYIEKSFGLSLALYAMKDNQ